MFHKNSRTERKNGIRFYEQDILYSDYLFTNDIVVELILDYYSPGVGIVLMENNSRAEDHFNNIFVFKVGYRDFTVIRRWRGIQETVLHVSTNIEPPAPGLELTFSKRGRMIELHEGTRLVGHFMLPVELDRYKIGFYSAAGNTLKSASYAAGAPNKWMINIKNTNGGRIHFFRDGFQIQNCEHDAEIEQNKVFLKKGRYHLAHTKENIDGKNDIDSFVFFSDDSRFDDKKKNLLSKDNILVLSEDAHVNIKFKGTSGIVKEIALRNNIEDAYVSTDTQPITTTGSEMIVDLSGLESVRWKGIINSIPKYESLLDVKDYGILVTKSKKFVLEDVNLTLGKEYTFKLETSNMLVEIYDGNSLHKTIPLLLTPSDNNKFSVFKNVDGSITQFIIKRTTGEEIDVLLQKTDKVFIPATIRGPITVTDSYYIPIDLSSSYRASVKNDGTILYLFTNWEREVFDPAKRLYLEKRIADISGNIFVYGIKKDAIIQPQHIYTIYNADSIDAYADKYDIITETNFEIDYHENEIILNDDFKNEYKEIVIDYLKDDSFSINYVAELHAYEVDISTSKKTIFILCDYLADGESGQGSVSDYKITEIMPDETKNQYVVLRN